MAKRKQGAGRLRSEFRKNASGRGHFWLGGRQDGGGDFASSFQSFV